MASSLTPTTEFLMDIAREEKIPWERMQEVAKKLQEGWYDNVASMKRLTLEQLIAMGIPSRASNAIVQKLKLVFSVQMPTRSELLSRLRSEIPTRAALQESIRTLQTIVYNLVTNPVDPRLREIKLTNAKFQSRIGEFPSAMLYLKQVGFQVQGDLIRITDLNQAILTEALQELNALGTQLGVPAKEPAAVAQPEVFNPYKAVTTTLDPTLPRVIGGENDPAVYTAQLEELAKTREDALRGERVDRNPQVFLITEGTVMQSIRRRNEVIREPLEEVDSAEDESLRLETMQSLLRANEENSRFQNKRKKMLAQLSKKKLYTKVTVQVRFPDLTMVQGDFSPLEKNADLYKFVSEVLEQRKRKFYLYFTPPKVKVPSSKFEVLEALAPSSLLYFAWEQEGKSHIGETTVADGPFLKQDALQRAVPLR